MRFANGFLDYSMLSHLVRHASGIQNLLYKIQNPAKLFLPCKV
jgi:hypothetical protein